MFKNFLFNFAHKINKKNPWIAKTFLWQTMIGPVYHYFRGLMYAKNEARIFFRANNKRVKKVSELFYDQETKKTFLGMINFRQTYKKSYHINHGNHTQYFINDFFIYGKNEVLIDCGSYNGDSIEKFLEIPNMEYEQIVAFEASTNSFKLLEQKFENNQKIVLLNVGVYSKDGELYFMESDSSSSVSEHAENVLGKKTIKVKAIDSLENLKKVTFIKMDIEGAEIEVLKGAEKTILRDKPLLAISIYHSNEDMLRIAEWVHALVPEYKLFCRQHCHFPYTFETVLYAL
ncbi:MAG: FkbM family methyltransferase [Fibromonadaceae bacterium]|jgi:FkbM family methyltransferase|nr:FkbM family methyltransferase [Fibromonadaceae bacterium]